MSTTAIRSALTQPYPGLRPFLQSEAELFFGRADDINRMLACLEENRFLAVVGGSGSGKSSLVRAGLLPALEKGYLLGVGTDWRFVVTRPGGDPFGNLAAEFQRAVGGGDVPDPGDIPFTQASLQTSPRGLLEVMEEAGLAKGAPLLVLVDQFEEIFRFRRRRPASEPAGGGGRAIYEERNDATAFVNLLLTTAEAAAKADLPIYIMLTMRSEFMGDCDVFPGLPQAISDSQFLVPRLNRRQIQEIVEKPLLLFGWTGAPDLVNQMLNAAGTDPDQLPLMQHALMRTWFAAQARVGGGDGEKVLTLGDYEKVGGFPGALSQHLEEAWAMLAGEEEQRIAQQLFLCLSEQGAGGALIRRMVKLGEVAAVADVVPAEVMKVVRVFQEEGRNFIMTSPTGELSAESVLDLSHEALLRQWPRLRTWLDEAVKSADRYLRLADGASRWKAGDADLLQGRELERAQEWQQDQKPSAAWAERYHPGFADAMDFLAQSRNAENEKNRRGRIARRTLWAGVAATCVILAGSTIWALHEKARALDLIHFMDAQIGAAFTKGVPLELRVRVSDRLDVFYRSQGEPATFADRQRRMGHLMRRAEVHRAIALRSEKSDRLKEKPFYIKQGRQSAVAELKEAQRLGDLLATESPDDRGVTRDRILVHYDLAMLSIHLKDWDAAHDDLHAARALLDTLVQSGPFTVAQYMDWMGLPNLDAAMGELTVGGADKKQAHEWYQKALTLQTQLVARRHEHKTRDDELEEIKKHLLETAP